MSRKSAADKLRKLGFDKITWGAGWAFTRGKWTPQGYTGAVGIVPSKWGRKKRRWYVGHIFMTDGTPAAFDTMSGPFDRWKDAVACFNVTAGVK